MRSSLNFFFPAKKKEMAFIFSVAICSAWMHNLNQMISQSIVKETKWVRCMMEKSAKLVGEDWDQDIKYVHQILHVEDDDVPEYFMKPLHGFKKGGNCAFQALYQSVSMRQIMRMFQLNSHYREDTMMFHLTNSKVNDNAIVLDIGCGSGDSTLSCFKALEKKNAKIIGVDLSSSMVHLAKLRYPLRTFEKMNAAYLNFEDASVDIITCFAMFHEMPHEYSQKVIKEFARVLKPGGTMFIWDQRISPFSKFQKSNNDPIEPFLDSYALLNITHELESNHIVTTEENEGMFKIWSGFKPSVFTIPL